MRKVHYVGLLYIYIYIYIYIYYIYIYYIYIYIYIYSLNKPNYGIGTYRPRHIYLSSNKEHDPNMSAGAYAWGSASSVVCARVNVCRLK